MICNKNHVFLSNIRVQIDLYQNSNGSITKSQPFNGYDNKDAQVGKCRLHFPTVIYLHFILTAIFHFTFNVLCFVIAH